MGGVYRIGSAFGSRPSELRCSAPREIRYGSGVGRETPNELDAPSAADLLRRIARLERALERQRRAREETEQLLEDRTRELFLANEQLEAQHAAELRLLRMQREFEIASRIQQSLLPRSLEARGVRIAAKMNPATEVGGDYYDVIEREDGVWIAIGDVSGHGLHAGLVMLMAQATVGGLLHSLPMGVTPREVLSALNDVLTHNIRRRLQRDDYMTFTLLRLDASTGEVEHVGAHSDLIVHRQNGGAVERLPTAGVWLGLRENIGELLEPSHLQLGPGDTLLLQTDGVWESARDGELLDYPRIEACVAEHASGGPDALIDAVMALAADWCPEADDDRTLLAVRRDL